MNFKIHRFVIDNVIRVLGLTCTAVRLTCKENITFFTFSETCFVIYLLNKDQQNALLSIYKENQLDAF